MRMNVDLLEHERKKRCMSKGDFAQLIGVSAAYYSGILKGKLSDIEVIIRMGSRLEIDPKDLLISEGGV